ncbi:hypothetical protein WJX72_004054 [[Myrmecia] bisecta]|uniref:Glutamine amidotransferase domain-containing protein n=1 Tax=[Myrmecia] bisecta TaxID=41462 RepID=A0AAW1R6I9_9CHLO
MSFSPCRYAVLDCEDAAKWKGHVLAYNKLYGRPDDTWDVYECYAGQLPDLDRVSQYQALFVTGSHCGANDDLDWIHNLEAWLHAFIAQPSQQTRLVALCFGSQLLAKALGGEVGHNPDGRFVLTVEHIQVTPAFEQKPYYRTVASSATQGSTSDEAAELRQAGTLRLIESHGDQVLRLPDGAELLASSATAPHEVWAVGKRALALQGHPELSIPDMLSKVHTDLTQNGRLSEAESEASEAALRGVNPDSHLVNDIINAFIGCAPDAAPSDPFAAGAASRTASTETPTAAPTDSINTRKQALYDKAGETVGALATAVKAQLDMTCSEYQTLQELNTAAAMQYSRLTATVAQAADHAQAVQAHAHASAPLLTVMNDVERKLALLETDIHALDVASREMLHQLTSPATSRGHG